VSENKVGSVVWVLLLLDGWMDR